MGGRTVKVVGSFVGEEYPSVLKKSSHRRLVEPVARKIPYGQREAFPDHHGWKVEFEGFPLGSGGWLHAEG